VLHRDLKPANILIDRAGRARIADFGLAKFVDRDGLTTAGAVVGTPSYMSPEQASGTKVADRRTDVYGLGAILYACLAGQAPFRGHSTMDTLKKVVNDRPVALRELRPGVPRDLATICEKCLEKDPQLRYQSAQEFADELTRFIEGRPILARPVPAWTRAVQWCRRKPLVAGMTAAILMLLIAGSAVSTYFAILAGRHSQSADRGFTAARQQSQLSLRMLQTLIHSVQDKLKNLPGAREIRRDILQQVLKDLDEVSNGYVESAEVDRESAKVLHDLANLYLIIGGEVGTDYSDFAETHFTKSVETYAALLDEAGGDRSLLQDAFSAAVDCGNNAREFRHFDKAIWAHRQAYRFAHLISVQFPEERGSENALLESSEALGEALLRSGQTAESRPYILDAVQRAERYAQEYSDIDAYDKLAACYCTVGDLHRVEKDLDAAAAAYQRMSDMTLKLMELDPDNKKLILDRSTDFERLGDLEMARNNYAKAIEYFEQSRENAELYMADDPTDLFRKQQSTWAYSKLAEACKAAGNDERANWAVAELAKLKADLKSPDMASADEGNSD
jgi:tetratricopeptide (TPR) repeat protein